jgi:hypothetical protein
MEILGYTNYNLMGEVSVYWAGKVWLTPNTTPTFNGVWINSDDLTP